MWKYLLPFFSLSILLYFIVNGKENQDSPRHASLEKKLEALQANFSDRVMKMNRLWILKRQEDHQKNLDDIKEVLSKLHPTSSGKEVEDKRPSLREDTKRSVEGNGFAQYMNDLHRKRLQKRYVGDNHIGKPIRSQANTTVILVHCEQLMVLMDVDSHGNTLGCIFSKRLFTIEAQQAQIEKWMAHADSYYMERSVTDFYTLMNKCFETEPHNVTPGWTYATIMLGIAPGTLWCGNNQLATDLGQLGREHAIDLCCRDHDLCPVQLPTLQPYKNLTSYGPLVLSHCDCDQRFSDCLEPIRSVSATHIYHVYFNTFNRRKNCVTDDLLYGLYSLRRNVELASETNGISEDDDHGLPSRKLYLT